MPAPRKHGQGVGGGRPKSADDGEGAEEEKFERKRESERLRMAEKRGQVRHNYN